MHWIFPVNTSGRDFTFFSGCCLVAATSGTSPLALAADFYPIFSSFLLTDSGSQSRSRCSFVSFPTDACSRSPSTLTVTFRLPCAASAPAARWNQANNACVDCVPREFTAHAVNRIVPCVGTTNKNGVFSLSHCTRTYTNSSLRTLAATFSSLSLLVLPVVWTTTSGSLLLHRWSGQPLPVSSSSVQRDQFDHFRLTRFCRWLMALRRY